MINVPRLKKGGDDGVSLADDIYISLLMRFTYMLCIMHVLMRCDGFSEN